MVLQIDSSGKSFVCKIMNKMTGGRGGPLMTLNAVAFHRVAPPD